MVSDDKRFQKTIAAPLFEVRNLAKDGLFTAYGTEPNWAIARKCAIASVNARGNRKLFLFLDRLLMPAFSTLNVRTMYEGMEDICDQLLLKWER